MNTIGVYNVCQQRHFLLNGTQLTIHVAREQGVNYDSMAQIKSKYMDINTEETSWVLLLVKRV